jgi:hypothetical protein
MMATGSAVAASDPAPVASTPTAVSPLKLARDTIASRDALRPSLSPSPTPKPVAKPVAKHLKKQAPIPKASSTKTVAAPAVAPKVTGSKYTTTDVNVWSAPGQKGTLLTVLARGSKVSVTGEVQGIWAQIVRNGVARWVKAQYLSATKPTATTTAAGGFSSAACKSGSAVEDGLTPDAIRVHRAICAKFPSVTEYGGLRSGDTGSEHATGHALDIMVSGSMGQEIADWLHANYKALGVSQLIWQQHIWTVQRSSEGWRAMPDRGSTTANHYDHVHVSVYGNAGTV